MCSDNPEVVGSNPAPATNVIATRSERNSLAGFLHCADAWKEGEGPNLLVPAALWGPVSTTDGGPKRRLSSREGGKLIEVTMFV